MIRRAAPQAHGTTPAGEAAPVGWRTPAVRGASPTAEVKSAGRTLDLLEVLAQASQPASHAALAARTAIPKSSLTQLLRTLQSRDYVESLGPGGPFRLGRAARHLVAFGMDVQRLVACAQPAMGQLCAAAAQSCGLNVLNGDVVERVHGVTAASGLAMHEGVRAPLYASSAGKLFLARMGPAALEQYFERVELRPLARQSIRSLGELHRQVRKARSEGLAYSHDEFTNGVVGVSAPVTDRHGSMVAALGLAVPTEAFTDRRLALAALLTSAAQAASAALAHASERIPP